MTTTALSRARDGDGDAFRDLTDPYRGELQLHCYRMLGSVQDAEDALQETLLAAWKGLPQFEERASVRSWLYKIATNRCLNALRAAGRRPRPEAAAFTRGLAEPTRHGEPLRLQPYPDLLLDDLPDAAPGPEARYESREALALAFVAGLQRLPPRQRAVLVLRDVLGYPATDTAEIIQASTASVTSALQRARATLAAHLPAAGRDGAPAPRSARERELVTRFADAVEAADAERLVALLTEDAWLTMPPETLEYQGPAAIAAGYESLPWWSPGTFHMVATRANGQPAFAYYLREGSAPLARAHGFIVLTLAGDKISAITRFDGSGLVHRFGLPPTIAVG